MSLQKLILTCFMSLAMFNLFAQDEISKWEGDFESIRKKIFPVIKVKSSADTSTIDSTRLVYKEIAGDLLCFYGVDNGKQFELISLNQLPAFVNIEMLEEIARQNLLRDTRNRMHIHKSNFGGGLGLDCGNRHEAALVTLPSIFKMMKERIGDNIVFAVPAEDLIIFVNGDNDWEIKSLLISIEEIHKAGERLLSKKLYVFSDGRVKER